jgi:hypothetical protein
MLLLPLGAWCAGGDAGAGVSCGGTTVGGIVCCRITRSGLAGNP